MSKIRVLLLVPTLDEGGAEKQLALLAIGLPRDRFDVTVGVLTRTGPRERMLRDAGVRIVEFRKRGKLDPTVLGRIGAELDAFRPDVVHTWIFAANAYGRWAALRRRVPVILGGERCVDPWKRSWELAIDRYLAKRTTGIVTNSAGVRDFYASKGIPADRFHVIPNGIEPKEVDRVAARRELAAAIGLDDSAAGRASLIVTVGRLWPQKRHKDLIWGTELLRCVRDDAHLLVIGDGPERWRLTRFAEQVRIADRVHFLGHRSDAARLVAGADQFWLGSGYEGQSNALMEAAAAGVPAVVSDIPGNRDLVIDGQTGLLFPVGDTAALARAARRLLDDPGLAARLGAAAARRIRDDFTVARMIDTHAALYERLVREASRQTDR